MDNYNIYNKSRIWWFMILPKTIFFYMNDILMYFIWSGLPVFESQTLSEKLINHIFFFITKMTSSG